MKKPFLPVLFTTLAALVVSGCTALGPPPTPTPVFIPLPPSGRASPTATPWPTATPLPTRTPTATPAVSATPTRPATQAWTPRPLSGRLVLQTASGGSIIVVSLDSAKMTTVAQGFLDPAWSPDGTRIAVASWNEPQGIYIMNADGSDLHLVYRINGAKSPTWSPDGTRIAFTWRYRQDVRQFRGPFGGRQERDMWRISIVDLNGRTVSDVPLDPDGHAFAPSWGPDGRIVYRGIRGLWVTDPAGMPQRITDSTHHDTPSWSPDGAHITFAVQVHDHWDIAVVASDGSGLTLLTSSPPILGTPPVNNVAPVWSPDGRSIAFASDRSGQWRLYVMDADGSNQRLLVDIPIAIDFASERAVAWTR